MQNKIKKIGKRVIIEIVNALPVLFFVGACIIAWIFYENNQDLNDQIIKRDNLIKEMQKNDSTLGIQNRKNAEIITKYISECDIIIDGKKLSTSELVNYLRNLYTEKYRLQFLYDSLKIMSEYDKKRAVELDSIRVYKMLYQLAERDYGIKYTIENHENSRTISHVKTKVDTALLIYPYFKDRITIDSSGKIKIKLN